MLVVPLKGEFGTVIGPSGSGKSTLYDILAGPGGAVGGRRGAGRARSGANGLLGRVG